MAVLETHRLTARQHQRIVPVRMGRAIAAAVDDRGLIQKVSRPFGVRRGITHLLKEPGKLAREELIPLA